MLRAGIVIGLTWCALALAPQARAATFAELPFTAGHGVATCLRATGEPGELTRLGPVSRTSSAIDVMRVTDAGAHQAQRVAFDPLLDCPAVASAGGAGVIAGPVRTGKKTAELHASVREPGSAFAPPLPIGAASPGGGQPAAAIAPSGAAVVAWAQVRGARSDTGRAKVRILTALRPAGGGFGPARPLTPWRKAGYPPLATVAAAIDPAGRAVVAWARSLRPSRPEVPYSAVELATAEPGGGFGATRRIDPHATAATGPTLAAAPDGHVLLAYSKDTSGVRVRERVPGAGAFTPLDSDLEDGEPAVAVRSGGGAVVASLTPGGVAEATTRPSRGPLGAPQLLTSRERAGFGFGYAQAELSLESSGPVTPLDERNLRARVDLAPDGTAVLTFGEPTGLLGDARPFVSTGSVSAGFAPAARLGTPLRTVNGVVPLRLQDGRAAVAWTDNLTGFLGLPDHGGRIHVAADGARAAPLGPTPHVRISVPRGQRLHPEGPLRVRVHCDAACDLRVTARRNGRTTLAARAASLPGPGTAELALRSGDARPWGRVTVAVQAGPPGGPVRSRARARAHVKGFPPAPFARPLAVRARRTKDGRVIVTWRTASPARRMIYVVAASPAGIADSDAYAYRHGRGRRSFRVVLKPQRRARRVELYAVGRDYPQRQRRVVVPISGRRPSS